MGGAVGTQAAAAAFDGGEEIVRKARALLKEKPTLSDEEVVKELGVSMVDEKVIQLVRERALTDATDAEIWAEVNARLTEASIQKTEVEKVEDTKAISPPDMSNCETRSMMSPEFKRSQLSKNLKYPPITDSFPRLLPRNIIGSFSCHGQTDVGKLKENQDRGVVCYPFNCAPDSESRALFIVADGHGEDGHSVSDFVVKRLVTLLSNLEYDIENDIPFDKIKDAFQRTNKALVPPAFTGDATTSGTTCVAAILRPKYIITANTGDSRIVLGRNTGPAPAKAKVPFIYKSHDLTEDHKPDSEQEKKRIIQCGGFVTQPEWSASSRVWVDEACTWPGLAMARSIGDHCVKDVGVTAEPDVAKYFFQPEDTFLVIATDGIWEFLSSEDVCAVVGINLHSSKHKGKSNLAEICAMELIKCAIKQWKIHEDGYRDDITCTVILLPALQRGTASA